MQIIEKQDQYDVVIVGSGAGGGMSTKILSDAGLKVAVVEAGPFFDPKDPVTQTQWKWPYESPRRGAGTRRVFGEYDMAYGGWELPGEPYNHKNGTKFNWYRSRMLGGRTNHWGRISLRFGPRDFKAKDRDGLGENWPIGYEDVKPYYDKVDKLLGIFGSKEGLYNEPDGFFLPPPKPRLHELYYKRGAEIAGVKVIPSRLSILTKRINQERGICVYCRQCARACNLYADFSSGSCLIFPAQNSNQGRVDLYLNAMVREVSLDDNNKASGVIYVNKDDRKEYTLKAKVVVLAASACSTARILLNSKTTNHPAGLGNSSGLVGRYLHDSTGSDRAAFIPKLMNRELYNEDGVGGMHLYSPWWLDNSKLDFPRGYHIEVWGGLAMPSYGTGFNPNSLNKYLGLTVGGYGNGLREDVKRFFGSVIGMSGRGESVPIEDNYCEIDPTTVDEFGIPALRFHYKWSDYERKQAKHMHDTFEEIIHNFGGIPLGEKPSSRDFGLLPPGTIIHEVGTTRMGKDPKTSVTNEFQQLHDVDNVFITDAGPFVSQADKNPTWTIMALAWRSSDYLIEQLKNRNL